MMVLALRCPGLTKRSEQMEGGTEVRPQRSMQKVGQGTAETRVWEFTSSWGTPCPRASWTQQLGPGSV